MGYADESEVGRYQIEFSRHSIKDTFLLDTVTGKTWRLVEYLDLEGEPEAWEETWRIDLVGPSIFDFLKRHPPKEGE